MIKARDEEDKILMSLCERQTILTFVSCLSTLLIMFTVPLFNSSGFISVDCLINSMCILFCNKNYRKMYEVSCCGMIKCSSVVFRAKKKMEVIASIVTLSTRSKTTDTEMCADIIDDG